MKRRGNRGCWYGRAAILVGAVILMALILPTWFWWLVCGGLLIGGGIWVLRF